MICGCGGVKGMPGGGGSTCLGAVGLSKPQSPWMIKNKLLFDPPTKLFIYFANY